MPRTKRTTKTIKREPSLSSAEKLSRKREVEEYIIPFDIEYETKMKTLQHNFNYCFKQLEVMKSECKNLISHRVGNATIEEVEKGLVETTYCTVSDITGQSNILESTSTIKKKTAKYKRSSSVADEGYSTSEASDYSGGTRKSRTDTKRILPARASRSLSRNKTSKATPTINNYKTPARKIPNDFGFVTPKVKPNTPQVILRRPKEGEMAISMQGSPLMVNTIVTQDANVNIPLEDGRTISIQPQRGLRLSQLPHIDSTIKRQIEVLRDNLIKMCDASK